MKPCNFFDEAIGFCDRVVVHESIKDDAMVWLFVFIVGICWLLLKALESNEPKNVEREISFDD